MRFGNIVNIDKCVIYYDAEIDANSVYKLTESLYFNLFCH